MDAKTAELIDVLEQLALVLESDDDTHWSRWMRTARGRLLEGDDSGVDYLRRAYGGMGSINDLVLGRAYADGVLSWKAGYGDLNQRFVELRDRAASLADDLLRARA